MTSKKRRHCRNTLSACVEDASTTINTVERKETKEISSAFIKKLHNAKQLKA